ncbi:6-phosphogluconolactonase [Rhodopseudomonas pseudopalustris]|uniref:6-phosphogluconolactonase n=1 Tax=Rhodopseudomonas pseudopalustris TaxID=1513892 RepID=A0A1H8QMA4_9BRAD|nr:6-phosphogluconolactonase [Rhodopseudomonas pseudopalustris]SEO54943.1 6-phosphogluconolactonase [Rhodopseudomonas pseudopalustris]
MRTADGRQIVVAADAEALARLAAQRLIARIELHRERPAICLTGGSGPQRMFELLATEFADRIPWPRVHWFISDERFVPFGDPLSNMGTIKRVLLDGRAPPENVHAIPAGDSATPDEAARRYQHELQSFYGAATLDRARPLFDLVLGGVGPDGHTASLFPGWPQLGIRDRWAAGVDNAHVEPLVPRVTLTFPALASCAEMLFLVHGASKRDIVGRVFAGDDLPAGHARSIGETVWLITADALPETLRDR